MHTVDPPVPATPEAAAPRRRWGPGRIVVLVGGSLAGLVALAALAGGGTALVYDQTQRDPAGYLSLGSTTYSTATYALVSDDYRTGTAGDWLVARDLLGTVRVRSESSRPVFVGIGRTAAVDAYLADVRREVATSFDADQSDFRLRPGGAPAAPPTAMRFWAARSVGAGTQTLTWTPQDGSWRLVVMNPDGTARVQAELKAGARFPHLLWLGIGFVGGGGLLLLLAGAAIYAAAREPARA
jgi:hypothetical protein